MTDDYVIINGMDTREIGVFCTSLPPIQIPSERVSKIAVPGRSGLLTIKDDSFDAITKTCGFFYEGDDPSVVAKFIKSATTLVFSNEPDKVYTGACYGQTDLVNTIFNWHEFTVDFECDPEKRESNPQEITGVSGMTLFNPGNRPAYPTFEVTGAGGVVLTVGTEEIILFEITDPLVIDGETGSCYTTFGEPAGLQVTGDFPVLLPGSETVISWTAGATGVIIRPNWRYL